ncbi:NfeD family protein [Oleiagrimonas soli]|uniref:Membrane protein implicated in regulation of membrane protease activity n=1 Tax=Oleiagrimonas soli TaxID=1543381 RepID=A0A099CTU9_9GAMM|nr:NfeD family protein [Oleiagrimonas soli]KGI77096.1 hypothetical protein LF63_0112675 [Oleiagrimonas soli]MBB6185370.1 membrane protein implicated in regulation of membrane protease activity [Oleiagrimonas soli]
MNASQILGTVLLAVGAIVAVSEMHTLTIYLIAVAVACFVGAGVAFAGASLPLTLGVAAVVAVLGMPVAHWMRGRLRNHASEHVTHDDVGRTVQVVAFDQDHLRVSYRGTAWNARMQDASATTPHPGQTLRIVAREGNVLVLAAVAA